MIMCCQPREEKGRKIGSQRDINTKFKLIKKKFETSGRFMFIDVGKNISQRRLLPFHDHLRIAL